MVIKVLHPIRQEGEEYSGGYSQENNITYTYENDNNGYPVIQFENSDILNNEKSREYVNFYRDDKFVGSAYNNLEIIIESDNYSYKRYGYHGGNLKETDEKGLLLRDIDGFNYYNRYYIPSFDGTKMIDMIYIDYRNKHLFECPYCN